MNIVLVQLSDFVTRCVESWRAQGGTAEQWYQALHRRGCSGVAALAGAVRPGISEVAILTPKSSSLVKCQQLSRFVCRFPRIYGRVSAQPLLELFN